MKNNHNLLMKMKNLEKFSGAIKRCVAIAMASMLFATTGFSLDTHSVKAQEVSSSADKIEIPEISKDAFKKLKGDNKQLLIIPGANHVDLYDTPAIPFDKIEEFFKTYLK